MKICSIFILLFFFTAVNSGKAQTTEIDSLTKVTNTSKDPAKLFDTHILLARKLINNDMKKALQHGEKALEIAKNKKDVIWMSKANLAISIVYVSIGKYEQAHKTNDKALEQISEYKQSHKLDYAKILKAKGLIEYYTNNQSKAMQCYLKASEIFAELGDTKNEADMINNIAAVYYAQENYDKAIEYFLLFKNKQEEMRDSLMMAYAYNNLGVIYLHKLNNQEAKKCLLKALPIVKNDKKAISADVFSNLSRVYHNYGQNDSALFYQKLALPIREKLEDIDGINSSYVILSNIHLALGNAELAKDYNSKSIILSNRTGNYFDIMEANDEGAKMYAKLGEYKNAYHHQRTASEYKDSISEETMTNQIAEMEAKYLNRKKEMEIERLETEKANEAKLSQLEQSKQRIILFTVSGGLVLVPLFALFLYRRMRTTARQKKIIEQQKTAVDDAYGQLEEKNNEVLDSINYAKRIQSAILPSNKLVKEYLQNSFILYKPKDIVSGDFYWMETIGNNVLFAVADCTGHGVPGAMVSVVCSNALNRSVLEFGLYTPGKILDKTRELVIENFKASDEEVKDGMDIALCSLNTKNNTLHYAGANNPIWVIRKSAEKLEEIKPDKQPIGKYTNEKPFTTHTIQLNEGDSFYIFSDGFPDQFGGLKGKKYKYRPFKELLLKNSTKPMEEQRTLLNKAFEEWKGDLEQIDDVCIIGVRL